MPVEITEISCREPDLVQEIMDAMWGGERPARYTSSPESFHCEMKFMSTGELGADSLRSGIQGYACLHFADLLMTFSVLGGTYDRYASASDEVRLRRGDVGLLPPDILVDANFDDIDVQLLHIPRRTVSRVAAETVDFKTDTRFLGLTAVSAAAARAWQNLTAYVHHELAVDDPLAGNPLISRQLCDLIAANALRTFPNSTMRQQERGRQSRAVPTTVKTAVEFIDAHAHEPITLTDIAQALSVTPRALQLGFSRHLDTTPMRHLRNVRLERSHQDLQAADPNSGITVGAIARSWGFTNSGRFSLSYRQVYGRPPSSTLNS